MEKRDQDVFFKWLFGGLILLAVLYFFPWKDITWGRVLLGNEGMVTVSGYAETNVENQVAMFSAGVSAINDDKDTAVNEVNTKMTALIASVKELGIEDKDIKTQSVNVYQLQQPEDRPELQVMPPIDGGRVKLGQWNASNTIEITLRDVDLAGRLTDTLNESGATNVFGPNFRLDTSIQADDSLLEEAVADAKQKAERIAKSSGSKLGRVISVTEGGQASPVSYLMKAEATLDSRMPAPIEVGSSKVSKTVTVVWSLR